MPWHLVQNTETGEAKEAYADDAAARHRAMALSHEFDQDHEALPMATPRPLGPESLDEDGFARLAPIIPPDGLDEIGRFTGFDPAKHLGADGTILPMWEAAKIVRLELPKPLRYLSGVMVSRVAIHERILPATALALEGVLRAGLWEELEPYGGGFVPRLKRTVIGPELSTHAYGLALDFDPAGNPMGVAAHLTKFGGTARGREVVSIFHDHGFYWGGHFSRPDGMHFQFARGY